MRTGHITWPIYIIALGALWYFMRKKASEKAKHDVDEHIDEKNPESDAAAYDLDAYWAGGLPPECEEIIDIIRFPSIFKRCGSKMPKGLLLYGDPGTGKTYFGKTLANIVNAHFFYAAASQMDEIYVGSGPKKIRNLFKMAKKAAESDNAEEQSNHFDWLTGRMSNSSLMEDVNDLKIENSLKNKKMSIIFLDELDAFGNRESYFRSDSRHATLSQLLTCMDGIKSYDNVLVIGATNYLNAIDSALTRSGRFDRLIHMSLPDEHSRYELLSFYLKVVPNINVHDWNDVLNILSRVTEGFNCSDLRLVINEATLRATRKTINLLKQRTSDARSNKSGSFLDNDMSYITDEIDGLVDSTLNSQNLVEAFLYVHDKVLTEANSASHVGKKRVLLTPSQVRGILEKIPVVN